MSLLDNATKNSLFAVVCLSIVSSQRALPQELVRTKTDRYAGIESLVAAAIEAGESPGAVVVVANSSDVVYASAFGHRQTEPVEEPMTLDTVFDLASITKPVATATSVIKLFDKGKVDLNATVQTYLPEFGDHGKDEILVSDLLLHIGGLIPDNSLRDYRDGPEEAWKRICDLKPIAPHGTKFAYTDVGFIVLGRMVQQVSGRSLDHYAKDEIFDPLEMRETMFNPPPSLQARAAATEQRDGQWIKGVVHDPRAYLLDGVAGHAGLFSTAADLLRYGRAMLHASKDGDSKLLSHTAFETFTKPRDVFRGTRTYGWDNQSPYSSNRGEKFSERAFGHGGFTGTVLWIDPAKDLVFIFLSTRLHPDGKGGVNRLAGKIATLIATEH